MAPGTRHLPAALLLTLAAITLGACGSSDDTAATTAAAQTGTAAQERGRFSAEQVAELAGFTAAGGGTWKNATGCEISAILTTRAEVQTYLTSPDALVVVNPAGDAGVRFEPTPGCRESLQANLTKVR